MIHGGRSGRRLAALAAAALCLAGGAAPGFERSEERAPCADREPLRRPFFGDLHVHTRYSLDASTQGTRNGPREAYRFARGEALGVQPYDAEGRPLRRYQLERPLDFAAVTDHAELFGELTICETPGLPGYDSLLCRLQRSFPRAAFFVMNTLTSYPQHPARRGFCGPDGRFCREAAATPWRDVQEAAEAAYDRGPSCSFTTFVGYEWTAAPGSNNLHRNVIFRNAVAPELPTTYVEEPTPEGLWRALRRDCLDAAAVLSGAKGVPSGASPGCDALVIPHNSNLSGGLMFRLPDDLTAESARVRAAMEPLVEVMQHKGDSECLPDAGSADELCGFEKLPYANFQGKFVPWLAEPPPVASFVRDALKRGLLEQARIGANPFQFGIVASTDTHLATAGLVEERADYPGHGGAGTPAAHELPPGLPDAVEFNPGGLAVLWAEENSRDALFDAMRRREAYGTSGPRLVARFFGGWDYPPDLCGRSDFAATGYARGVPMGGVLSPRRGEGGPRFAVWALRDPGTERSPGTPLQRIQIVKGWVQDGAAREQVLDVAGDAGNGAGVDPNTCEPHGAGADELCAVWSDPDFDAAVPAFYYARVVENPTCRWSARACLAAHVDCSDPGTAREGFEACCDAAVPKTVQERAWTSPIFYVPEPPT
jgi:hypothetical protein